MKLKLSPKDLLNKGVSINLAGPILWVIRRLLRRGS